MICALVSCRELCLNVNRSLPSPSFVTECIAVRLRRVMCEEPEGNIEVDCLREAQLCPSLYIFHKNTSSGYLNKMPLQKLRCFQRPRRSVCDEPIDIESKRRNRV